MEDLKRRIIRGGLAKLVGQAVNFILRILFLVVMARLLGPNDFGLVAMVTVVTGFYGMFTTAGLSSATIQRSTVTDEQISTLFWVNMLVGVALACLCVATAPLLVRFYDEPRLFSITIITGSGFILNAAAVQHSALLQRQMRFVTLALIETVAQLSGLAVGITMAIVGFGYWALVASTVIQPATTAICVFAAIGWIPGMPRRNVGIHSMLRFGGTVTLNDLLVYIAYNAEKVLLGRYWGSDVLGLYTRAYMLTLIPTHNLNFAVGGVTFAALSRLRDDPTRFRAYFLKSYSFANSLTLPITMFCGLFADDIILVVLGPKWSDAASIFRLLSPTVLVFGIVNPLSWLLMSSGLQVRSLKIALLIAPVVITSYLIGLPYGPNGVALAYSAATAVLLVPCVLWSLYGTPISPWDIVVATSKPLISGLIAAAAAFAVHLYFAQLQSPFLRIAFEGGTMLVFYSWALLFLMGQKTLYLDLLKGL